jgi:hypothetical protein
MSDNSNSKVVELKIFAKEGNYSYHNCTSKFQLAPYLSGTLEKVFNSKNTIQPPFLVFFHLQLVSGAGLLPNSHLSVKQLRFREEKHVC